MAKVNIENDCLIIVMEGVRKLWAFKNELSIPLANVLGASTDSEIWEETPKFGEKRIGVDLYGFYFAGTFVQDGRQVFYDLERKEHAIVITLDHEDYQRLIIGVDDPETTVELIENALNNKTR